VESKGGSYDSHDTDGEDGDELKTASKWHCGKVQEEQYRQRPDYYIRNKIVDSVKKPEWIWVVTFSIEDMKDIAAVPYVPCEGISDWITHEDGCDDLRYPAKDYDSE
jgi:hypothetical protein